MDQKIKQLIYWVFMCFIGFSCEEFRAWELESQAPQLVVQAILTDEFKVQELTLSQSFSTLSDTAIPISDALVLVSTGQITYPFVSDGSTPGTYRSIESFKIFSNLPYELFISWEGEIYTASSVLSSVAPIREFSFRATENDEKLAFSFPELSQIYNPSEEAMYEVDIDWSHLGYAKPNQARLYYYTFDELYLIQLVGPPKQELTFPKGSQIFIKKYGLNPDFGAYLRGRAFETDWKGSFYFATSDNVPSNLSKGALGFFSTCAVLTDTLIAQ